MDQRRNLRGCTSLPINYDMTGVEKTLDMISTGISQEDKQMIMDSLQKERKIINTLLVENLITACNQIQKLVQVQPKFQWVEITQSVLDLIFTEIDYFLLDNQDKRSFRIPLLITQDGQFLLQSLEYTQSLLRNFLIVQREIIKVISSNDFDCSVFRPILEAIIENETYRVCQDFTDFALIDSCEFRLLFEKIKETVYIFVKDLDNFLYKSSLFANKQMKLMDQLFNDNPALVNIRTYWSIQVEVASYIIEEIKTYFLQEETVFWRPEFEFDHVIKDTLVKNVIVYFYNYSWQPHAKLEIPFKTCNFKSSFARMGVEVIDQKKTNIVIVDKSLQATISTTNLEKIEQVNSAVCNNIVGQLINTSLNRRFFLYISDANILLIELQLLKCMVQVLDQSFLGQKKLGLCEFLLSIITLEKTDSTEQQLQVYLRNSLTKQVLNKNKNRLVYELIDLTEETKQDMQDEKKNFIRKIQTTQTSTSQVNPEGTLSLACGAIGCGIGILIVDCLDKKISWNSRLQRAGLSTFESSVFGVISYQLPVVGLLISQMLLLLVVKKTVANPVLTTKHKWKRLGHFGLQTSVGMGSAIAGQMLIPVPFLGALIGGAIGGISVGLYQKFVIPKTRSSILQILERVEANITENGQLVYTLDVVDNLRINKKHLFDNQPADMDLNDWMTLALVNLVNEIYYLFMLKNDEEQQNLLKQIEGEKKLTKSLKLKEELINKVDEFEQMELQSVRWERSRYYLETHDLSTFRNALNVNKFVLGMIQNFKI